MIDYWVIFKNGSVLSVSCSSLYQAGECFPDANIYTKRDLDVRLMRYKP